MPLSGFPPEVQRKAKIFFIMSELTTGGMTTDDAVECMRRHRLAWALKQPALRPVASPEPARRKGTGPLCAPVYQSGLGK